jgi:hypothetical protein
MSERDEVDGKMNRRFHVTAKIIGSTSKRNEEGVEVVG